MSPKLALWTLASERFCFVTEFAVFAKMRFFFSCFVVGFIFVGFFSPKEQMHEGIYQNPSDPTSQLSEFFKHVIYPRVLKIILPIPAIALAHI